MALKDYLAQELALPGRRQPRRLVERGRARIYAGEDSRVNGTKDAAEAALTAAA